MVTDRKELSYTSLRCAATGIFAGLFLLLLRWMFQAGFPAAYFFLLLGFAALAVGLWFDKPIVTAVGAFACALYCAMMLFSGGRLRQSALLILMDLGGYALLGVACIVRKRAKLFGWISAGLLCLTCVLRLILLGGVKNSLNIWFFLIPIAALTTGMTFSRAQDNSGRPERYRTAAAGMLLAYGVSCLADLIVSLAIGGLGLSGSAVVDLQILMQYVLLPVGAILAAVGLFRNKRFPAIIGIALLALPVWFSFLIVELPHAAGSAGLRRRLLSELPYCVGFVFPLLAAILGKKNWLFAVLTAGSGAVWVLAYLIRSGALQKTTLLRMNLAAVPVYILLFGGLAISCVGLIREQRGAGMEAAGPGSVPAGEG